MRLNLAHSLLTRSQTSTSSLRKTLSDSTVISVTTYDDSGPLDLEPRDVAFIGDHLGGRVSIRREIVSEQFILNSGAYAGLVRLPSGVLIRAAPRIPTESIFRMIAVAHGLPELTLDAPIRLDHLDQMLEFVADHFATRLEERIEQGLYRAYVEREDNLSVVRGRIDVAADIRSNYVLRHRTYCRYAELTWDVPENQVLRYVANRLSGWPFARTLQSRLQQLDRRMDEVARVPFVPQDIDRFVYSRLNAGYESLHALCKLLLQDMSLSEESGEYEFVSFLIDMNMLFERFIGEMFRRTLPGSVGRVELQRIRALGRRPRPDGTIRPWGVIRPDIEVTRGSRVVSVLDTKYKKTTDQTMKNQDFYQVLSYCAAEDTSFGGLIYPKSEFGTDDEIFIRHSDIRIRRFAVDLAVSSHELMAEAEGLVRRAADWMSEFADLSETA
jgi:5-methylcytosine-specific restriction enzyme subunit McrC